MVSCSGIIWGYLGIVEKEMETTIQGLGLRRFLKAYQGRVILVGQGPRLLAGFAHSALSRLRI